MPQRFPVNDPEPPGPGPGLRLVRGTLATAAALAVVAGLVAAGSVLTRPALPPGAAPRPPATAGIPSVPAGIVYVDKDSYRVTGDPGPLVSGLARLDELVPPFVSPTGDALLTFSGLLVPTSGARSNQVVPSDPSAPVQPVRYPWAGHGRYVVLQAQPVDRQLHDPAADYAVSLLTLDAGALTPVAPGAEVAAGDPDAAASYVVTGGREVVQGADRRRVSAALERRSPGAVPQRLADAASLAHAAGLPGDAVIVDQVAPSPEGSLLAVTVSPADAAQAGVQETLVVLRRDGTPVAAAPPTAVDAGYGPLSWSARGDLAALVYGRDPGGLPTSERLRLWRLSVGSAPSAVALPGHVDQLLPGQGGALGPPVWAPDGSQLVTGDDRAWWIVGVAARGAQRLDAIPGRPIAWLSR